MLVASAQACFRLKTVGHVLVVQPVLLERSKSFFE